MKGEGASTCECSERIETESESLSEPGGASEEGELKITVRKLELPVRPRGVLAE